ncbi:MAG TPA: TonB-dependent receptor [Mariniphaga sp.]|nr:TonB-dependent receptor [Mariniphaga sp.]
MDCKKRALRTSFLLLFFVLLAAGVYAQQRTISGTVVDQSGLPLPGVSVVVKGTTTGTVTDGNGIFSLSVPANAEALQVSFVGMRAQEVPLAGRTTFDITLEEETIGIEEVVAIGYGTVRKSDLTGSVVSVGADEIAAYPTINAVQSLQGRAAGLQISSNNGEPGASQRIRIRGGTSISASSDPIFVVDGFVGAALPPPEDIQSIEVLKDASATAIYGSRGANGVIMVTTKRGRTGAATIELNTSYSMQNEINRLDLLNGDQFMEYIREARPNIEPAGANTDWQDEIFRTGHIQNYQLSISGGSDNVNYYVSGTMYDQSGVIVNSSYDRFSITSNIDVQAKDWFKVGLNAFAQRSTKDGVRTQEGSGGLTPGVISSAFKFEPDQSIYDENGRFTIGRLHDPIDNPYAIATQLQDEDINDRFQGNAYGEFQLMESLRFRTTFGATTNSGRRGRYSPTTLQEGRNAGGGDARVDGTKSTLFLNENYLTYDRTFQDIHHFTAMAGYSFQSSESESWGGRSQSFITDAISFWGLGSGAIYQAPNSSFVDWRISSYYGRLNYTWQDRFLVTFNARYDGSSNFSANRKWAFFPSGALGWNMGNEAFLEDANWLSSWKWRLSYGLTGNQAISPYETLARFSPVFSVIGGNAVNAARPTTVANDNLTWETTSQLNLGADISLINDRISLTFDLYRMVTSDLLFSVQLPQYTGYTTQIRNIGEVENKGFEAMFTSRNFTGNFQWKMDVNVSANRNKVLTLPDGNEIQYGSGPGHMVGLGNTQVLREGEPVGSFFGWIYDGVYQEGDNFIPGGGFEQIAGGEKFRDIDGRNAEGELTGQPDNVLNNDDRTIIGDPNPDFIYGWNNDFRWRNFDLNIFFQGSQGNDILSYTLMELDLMAGINNATTNALNRWSPSNTDTDVPKAVVGRTRRVSTRWIYDGSYIRLKNISLGYNLPSSALDYLNVSKLRIFVSAQNIFTLTDYPGYDPEVNYNSGGSTNGNRNVGLDYGSYPNAKSYTFGINIGF